MVTVTNPSSNPSVIYNRGGVTIDYINPTGTSSSDAYQIVATTGHTVVEVTTTSTGYTVMLPASPDIGDVVEIYQNRYASAGAVSVYGHGSDTIQGGPSYVTSNGFYRRISASDWAIRYGAA